MKKAIYVFVIIIISWFLIILTDFILPYKYDKKPIFTFWGEKEKDGGSGIYGGLGYSISIKGNFNQEQKIKIYYIKLKVLFIPIYTYSG